MFSKKMKSGENSKQPPPSHLLPHWFNVDHLDEGEQFIRRLARAYNIPIPDVKFFLQAFLFFKFRFYIFTFFVFEKKYESNFEGK